MPGGLEGGAAEERGLMMVTTGWDRAGSDASHYGGNVSDPPVFSAPIGCHQFYYNLVMAMG